MNLQYFGYEIFQIRIATMHGKEKVIRPIMYG